ncbi:hypothetical protein [Nesterenkonia marinintestina]|uniref:hypothetical protein n=1 Tax=Nesterenkonia marinintestina TaxID=2979865 RepID=UPI0021C118DF|nr:hypothetical protein [Nesterenkonia sp. GX14115]
MSTDLTSTFSVASAREFTDEMKSDYASLQERVAAAWQGRIWIALGYEDWQSYLDTEFSGIGLRPPKELEEQVLSELRAAGMSTRGIAAATEMSQKTVSRRLGSTESDDSVDRIVGLDGKDRPARRAPGLSDHEEIVDAEIVEDGPQSPGQVSIADELGDSGWSGGDRSAEDMGLRPVDLSAASADHSSREYVRRQYGQLLGEAGGGIPAVNAAVNGLSMTLAVNPLDHKLREDELTAIAAASADSTAQLAELLAQIARTAGSESSRSALNATALDRVDEAIEKLQSVRAAVHSTQ